MGAFNPQLIAQLMQARGGLTGGAGAIPLGGTPSIPAGWQAALQGLNAGPYAAGGAMSPVPPGAQSFGGLSPAALATARGILQGRGRPLARI